MTKKSIHERILATLEREEAYKNSFPPEIPEDTKRQCWNARQNLLGHFSDEQIKQFIQDYLNGNLKAPALGFLEDIEKLALVHHFEPKPAIERAKFYGGDLAVDGISFIPIQRGRKRGGEKAAKAAKEEAKSLHDKIEREAKKLLAEGRSKRELLDILSERFNRCTRQISDILKQRSILPTKKRK